MKHNTARVIAAHMHMGRRRTVASRIPAGFAFKLGVLVGLAFSWIIYKIF